MRRSAVTLAALAILLAPLHALGAVGLGCDAERATDACSCPSTQRDASEREEVERGPSARDTCCCELEPVSQTSPVPPASAPPAQAPLAPAPDLRVADVPSPVFARRDTSPACARGPPPAGSLLDQHIALLL